jgi:hypothetical protein
MNHPNIGLTEDEQAVNLVSSIGRFLDAAIAIPCPVQDLG